MIHPGAMVLSKENLVRSGMLHKILQDAQCHSNLPVACCMNEKSSFNIVHNFSPYQLNIGKFYSVNLRIQSKCGKIRTRKNSVFGLFTKWSLLQMHKHDKMANKYWLKIDVLVLESILAAFNFSGRTQHHNLPQAWEI